MHEPSVNQRAQQILKILVERYIQDGNPIGSRTLAEEYALGLSPATIRHILSDLENAGYLISPHTSAGRVPTPLGYRFFVNSLLTAKPVTTLDVQSFQNSLDPDQDISHLLQSASTLLSGLTQLIGVVALPKRNRMELRQVEFLGLSSNRILVILVLNNREVQNRIIHTDKIYSQSELQQAANYLNTHYSGKDLLVARETLSATIREDRDHMSRLLQAVVDIANKQDYVVAGQNNLMHYIKETNLAGLSALFQALSEKQDILNLLNHAVEAEGIQIFIGKESGYQTLDDCAIVTTSYSVDGEPVGSLGVIGPMRMPYDRVISAVDISAKLLSAALNQN